jgi:hypothetical protein
MFVGAAGFDQEGRGSLTPIRLKKGSKPARELTTLSGIVTARVLGEVRPLITVDNVLKAGGKVVRGTEGGSLTILDIAKDDSGQVKLRFQLDPPPQLGPVPTMIHSNGPRLTFNRPGDTADSPHQELTLVDDQGNLLTPLGLGGSSSPATGVVYEVTYPHQKGQGEPAKLIFAVGERITFDVPFTLKHVSLP